MTSVNTRWLVLIVLVAMCVSGWQKRSSSAKWEYALVQYSEFDQNKTKEILSQYGADGWELVSVAHNNKDMSSGNFYFKRLK